MFCPNCGSNNPDTATSCAQCNTVLKPGGGAPKFKGTMLMMNQPGAPKPAAPAAGAAGGAGPASTGAASAPSKLKGTMVGVAPPVIGAAPQPPSASLAAAAPIPTPAPMAPPGGPGLGAPGPDHQTFGSGAGVNPLGGTMVADVGGGGFGSFSAQTPPPPDAFGAPQNQGAPGGPMGAPPGADPFGPPQGGGPGAPGMGAPPGADPYGAPPGGGAYGGPPQGAPPGMGAPQQGYGAPPPQDFGQQVAQGFNQAGQAFGQGVNELGQQLGMTPYGAQGQPGMIPGGQPGVMQQGASDKTWNLTLILSIVPAVFGFFGVHRLYTGHIAIGLLQFFTAGGCGVWQIIDIIYIFTGKYTDKQGRPLLKQ